MKRSPWAWVILAAAASFVAQWVILPCMCPAGGVKTELAVFLDVCVLARAVVGLRRREEGRSWLIYLGLLLFSIPLIELIAALAGHRH